MEYSAVAFLEYFETDKDKGPALCFFDDTKGTRLNALGRKRSMPRELHPFGITECALVGLWNALKILWLDIPPPHHPTNLATSAIASNFQHS